MPGEQVRGVVTKDAGSWARVELREVVRASPHRVEPPCPLFGACGGGQGAVAASRRPTPLPQPVDECLLLPPALTDLVSRLGDLGDATALTLRVATATGALLAVIDGPVPPPGPAG